MALTLGEPAGIGPDITLRRLAAARRAQPAAVLPDRRSPTISRNAPSKSGSACRCKSSNRPRQRPRSAPHCRWSISASRSRRSRATPTHRAHRPRSPPSAARSPTCSPARACAVVTNPIAKNVLYRSGFAEPGHTEYLARLAEEHERRAAAPGDDAVVARTRGGPGHHSPAAARRGRATDRRPDRRDRPDRGARSARPLRHRAAASGGRRPQSACRRRRHTRRGRHRHRCARGRAPARRRHRCARPAAGRHAVSRRRARHLRRGAVHVSRSGADPDQDAGLRPRRQCHARAAVRAHVARSRHRLRHRRHRQGQSAEPDRCAARWPRGLPPSPSQCRLRAAHERDRRPAAAARRHPPPRLSTPRNRSARISCSISTSPPASPAQRARSRASTWSRSDPVRAG